MSRLTDRSAWASPRELVAARGRIVRLMPEAGGGLVFISILLNLLLGLMPVVFIVTTSIVLGRVPAAMTAGVGSPEWNTLVKIFLLAAAAFVAQQILTPLARSLGELVARRVDGKVFVKLMTASLRSPDIGPLEDQRTLEHLRGAASEMEYGVMGPGQACAGLLALLGRYTQLVGYCLLIGAAFSWPAAAGLGMAVMLHRYGQRGGMRKFAAVRFKLLDSDRKIGYLRQLAIQPKAGKEIRIFDLTAWLRDMLRVEYLGLLKPVWAERRRVYLWPFLWFAGWGLAVTVTIFGSIGATAGRTLTLTTFFLITQVALGAVRLGEYYPESDLQTAVGMHAYEAVERFAAAVEAFPSTDLTAAEPVTGEVETDGVAAGTATTGNATTNGTATSAATKRAGVPDPVGAIRFEDVSFHYPGQQHAVFDGLNLTIPVGRCTAIVGVNGAGKTTLVKLLARLYEPTSGAVLADGVDIRAFPIADWRSKLGVIFQDFIHYEASAADNIAFGAPEALADRAGVRAAAEAVGLAGTLDALPRGMDTPLARHVAGGAELSGGQWQRVALARALFALRHGSPIVVLDEPTASMDVRAEANFFDEFADLSKGATTVMISHRFSTVRRADLIVVLEHGRVAEQGSHEELLALNGRYAELFRMQADRFAGAELTSAELTDAEFAATEQPEGVML
jgi:ATP-binding cassette subfamily B protein